MAYWCLVYRWIDSGFIEFSIIRIDGVWLVRTLTHLDTDGGCTTTGHYNLKKSLIGADLKKQLIGWFLVWMYGWSRVEHSTEGLVLFQIIW